MIQAKRSFVKCGDWFIVFIVCLHPSVSLNNEKICREISEDKIADRLIEDKFLIPWANGAKRRSGRKPGALTPGYLHPGI